MGSTALRLMFVGLVALAPGLGCPGAADDDSGSGDNDAGDDDGADDDTSGTEMEFRIELTEYDDWAYGSVANPVQPELWWVPEMEIGDCVFHLADLGFCDPPCVPPELCSAADECVMLPDRVSAGEIVVEGLKADLTLVVEEPYQYYTPLFDPEPAGGDIFDEGDPISAMAAGDVVPAFQVQTTGVTTLQTSLACPLEFAAGQPLEVAWTPASQGDSIRFVLRSGNHGAQFSSVVCATADDGELTVDAALVDAYLAQWRPVELWNLVRYSEGSAVAGETLVTLRAVSGASCMW
jgi:hypothetical protein